MITRVSLVLAVALCMSTVWESPGLAANLPGSSTTLGANITSVPKCDINGVSVVQVMNTTNVTGVTVSNIASACAGGSVSLTLNTGAATRSGTATVPGGGGSVTVTFGTSVAQSHAEEIDFTISGP